MQRYEYKVVPAPRRGKKGKGIKGTEAQFANALSHLMNEAAAEGWEYQRTDSLPCEERQGLTGRTTVFQNMLVFRRPVEAETAAGQTPEPAALPAPEPVARTEEPAPVTPLTLSVDAPEGPSPSIGAPDPRVAATLTRDRSVAAE
ncbi:DUF4177 domain-containing protein [Ponticoccus sp. SC2-23]|uniref:DUF4177 domain-containing protein n=1 Tax=Alexandriicola marinus TaxID=2081710 RepID=UPI000FD726FD|nr:DUF4177 domain-containing protein [Alexandriicola marinus]MBM1219458.1 DUF4177 domain-containing protein [Ponticoccus sp. SC6-9]MBM1223470.1 DUF4177 domain-containing protein [Ponticoccus sp. SC6-15]MBM1229271.1 DUF4177 domain-containing protein [Ponticoccus sp. SC6-38]MBM1232436.1 DUF4177 domain-containing protein [Ponticoccus sp. SC6-45]MBM1237614.1 DUF4177 domain-containing protein [Ponticoccus sp. SC6-49]MBM1241447.1 DUF4177 domain-containing protein [Ponticoccus sp. SC2-64]MBM1245960